MTDPTSLRWHCVVDGETWPGCGRCWGCELAAEQVFADARRLLTGMRRLHGMLVDYTVDHDLDI